MIGTEWDAQLKYYIYDTTALPSSDYIARIMRETPIFAQNTTPLMCIVRNQGGDVFMHYNALALLLMLHKLDVRPHDEG